MISVRLLGSQDDINYEKEIEMVKTPESGAVVTFLGVVRGERGKVKSIMYEHYPGMTEKSLREVAENACGKFVLCNVSVIHRVAEVEAGKDAVFIAVSSSHRKAAFDGCSWIMDRIKEKVPIWKEILME